MKPVLVSFRPNVTVPAFGVMAVDTTEIIKDQSRIYDTLQWDGEDRDKTLFIINRGTNCTSYEIGKGSFAELATMAYTTENLAAGTVCGPTANSWEMSANGAGFVVLNATNTTSSTVLIQALYAAGYDRITGTATANVASNASTFTITSVTAISGTAPSGNTTVYNVFGWEIDSGGRVNAEWNKTTEHFEAYQARCPA
jgi:hypothetical protein